MLLVDPRVVTEMHMAVPHQLKAGAHFLKRYETNPQKRITVPYTRQLAGVSQAHPQQPHNAIQCPLQYNIDDN
ncbi:MAG: hypothetical protein CMH98_00040 [Oceanospirillaceae bacterium]|nr:hypothetical protein [Oceanospirillaceae bacterium]